MEWVNAWEWRAGIGSLVGALISRFVSCNPNSTHPGRAHDHVEHRQIRKRFEVESPIADHSYREPSWMHFAAIKAVNAVS